MITSSLFLGIEAEGPNKGYETLFVPYATFKNKQDTIKDLAQTVQQVYFNAGEDYGYSEDLLQFASSLADKFNILVTIEFDLNTYLLQRNHIFPQNVRIVLTIRTIPPTDIKFIGNEINWFELKNPIITQLNDPTYLKDGKEFNDA